MIRIPNPVRGKIIDPATMQRLVARLTQLLDRTERNDREIRAAIEIETDLDRAPVRIGALAVSGGEAYIAVGLTPLDWKQIT